MGQARRTAQMLSKYGTLGLQSAQKRLAASSDDVPRYLAGKEFLSRAGAHMREEYGSLLPPPEECSVRLEKAWEEGGEEAPAILVHQDALLLLQHAVPWHGKWDKPKGLLEFIAIACAPPSVVDRILDALPLKDFPLSALASGLFEAVRCHRNHLLSCLLGAFVELPQDPRLVAIACYTKNRMGLQLLLERRADPGAWCPEDCLPFPHDDGILMLESASCAAQASPLCLAVRGRSRLWPEVWSEAPHILDQLLTAGAAVNDIYPLTSLLSQVYPALDAGPLMQSQNAWNVCFHRVSNASVRACSEQWLHVAQMPEYVSTFLESGLLPACAAASRDPNGISVVSRCALRAGHHPHLQNEWLTVMLRLLEEPGNENAASEIVALADIRRLNGLNADIADKMWPCPVLRLALQCGHRGLLSRSLTQSTLDSYIAWKAEVLAAGAGWTCVDYNSLLFLISHKFGASVLEETIQSGIRFTRSDMLRCHDGVGTQLGPVGSLALAAKESAEETERALFGRLAVQLLQMGMDDAEAFICQNGAWGGLAALVALITPGSYLNGLPDTWFDPIREYLVTASS